MAKQLEAYLALTYPNPGMSEMHFWSQSESVATSVNIKATLPVKGYEELHMKAHT